VSDHETVTVRYLVDDVAASVDFEIISGPGGSQVLAIDPSGNDVELFQPAADGHPPTTPTRRPR
jgi:hypothetical protein